MSISPVIVIGMHRSGTSLVAQILNRIGIFIGTELNNHSESIFFLQLNQFLFRLAHSRWDNPQPFEYLLKVLKMEPEFNLELLSFIEKTLVSSDSLKYWGPEAKEALEKMDFKSFISVIDQPWGWKDPRNTYTLPIWLNLFPDAKVIHVYRNGVDAASSLTAREKKRLNRLQNPIFSCRCLELNDAFELWVEYVRSALKIIEKAPHDQVFSVCYEKLLTEAHQGIVALGNFLQLALDEQTVLRAMEGMRSSRAYAFLSKPELERFYVDKRHHPVMKNLGYDVLEV
jgi:hypothetical protein